MNSFSEGEPKILTLTCFTARWNKCISMPWSICFFLFYFIFLSGNGLCQDHVEPFLSGALVLKTVSLVLDVIEKIKCVWQRNVQRFALCVETA